MPTVKIPINTNIYLSKDGSETTIRGSKLLNGLIDELGHTVIRPGHSTFGSLVTAPTSNPGPVDGHFYWDNNNLEIVVAGGRTYKRSNTASTWTDITGTLLNTGTPVIFAEAVSSGTKYLFMCNGNKINYTDGTANTAEISDADAPTTVSHIAVLDNYLFANESGNDTWYFSDPTDPFSWAGTADSYDAEVRADELKAIFANFKEVFFFGEETIEVWFNQGIPSDPFARITGAFVDTGVIAPYSIKPVGNTFIFMNDKRRIGIIQGNQFVPKDLPIAKELASLSTVSDAIGDILEIVGKTIYLITFPTDQRTFAYDYGLDSWSEWTTYNSGTTRNTEVPFTHIICEKARNKWLAGSNQTGAILELDFSKSNGILFQKQTGNINHGTLKRKASKVLRIQVKSGQFTTAAILQVKTLDDGSNTWSAPYEIDLGTIGNTEFVYDLFLVGEYVTRKYEFTVIPQVDVTVETGASAFELAPSIILIDAEEDFEVMP